MKSANNINPPGWAMRFLSWYCKPELLEDLQGDLNEYFQRNLKAKGPLRARLIYILDVFKFLRVYTLRKPKFFNFLIQWIMIGSYIKTSGRSIVRNKLFSTINIIGLAISMSVGLLMISFLSDVFSYDDFHDKKDRIYRVNSLPQFSGERNSNEFASTSVKTGKLIQDNISGVEELTILRTEFGGDAKFDDKIIPVTGLWATSTFFNVFTFPLSQGDPATALKEPYSVVLTEKAALRITGDKNALGKTIKFDTINYLVTGIMKDIPQFSHLQFDALGSFTTKEILEKESKSFLTWTSMWQNYVYVLLPEHTDPSSLQSNLDKLSAQENAQIENTKITLHLQPLKQIALGKDLSNPIGPTMMVSVVWIIGGLTLIVILSACFNYTNLSIARSLRRSREVGIRKVIGALKGHVLGQFISEAIIISLLSLVFSFFIFLFLRLQFLLMAPELKEIVALEPTPQVVAYFILFSIATGILAGILPALFFSKVNAVQVLKDASGIKLFRHVNLRKALVVVQYTFSLIFITATVIGYNQYKHFLHFDLGFSTENILNINLQDNKADLFIKELAEIPEVKNISRSLMVTSVGNYYNEHMKYIDPQDSAKVWFNSIDENYIPLHGHKLLAGRNFTSKVANGNETEVIVNEKVLQRFLIGGKNPSKALGEIVKVDGKDLTIIGVLKDFHYGRVNNQIEPVMFRYISRPADGYVNAKIVSTDLQATLLRIDNAWRKIDAVHQLNAVFYDDQIVRAYSEFSAMLKIVGSMAFLAISIASMGLFGMVVFTTETKLKEISIRKVMGATEGNLIYLLSKGFFFLLMIAAVIALPITYLFFDQVVLANFAYHLPIGLGELISGLVVVLIIACLMIGSQTLKVARANPAQVLKTE